MTSEPAIEPSVGPPQRPAGKTTVMRALIAATTELIVEKGLSMSVREIAARAGVNHGLVHAYFGTKEALLTAAFEDILARSSAELDESGFPPPDLAERRNAELAKALARVMLESPGNPFSSNPVTTSWRLALTDRYPDLTSDEVDARVIAAASLGLGYALFADHLQAQMDLGRAERAAVDARIADLVAEIGGIPTEPREPGTGATDDEG